MDVVQDGLQDEANAQRPGSLRQTDMSVTLPDPQNSAARRRGGDATPPTVSIEGVPVVENSTQKHSEKWPAEGSWAESLDFAKSLKDAATLAHDLGLASTPLTPAHEGVAELPALNRPAPRPCSTSPVHGLAPADETFTDDDVQVHPQLSFPLDTSPDGVHNHPFGAKQEQSENPSSAGVLSPAASATALVHDVEDSDALLSIVEQECVRRSSSIRRS